MTSTELLLANQICFPVYAASRLITRQYQPFLDRLGITYPQYLVLLVLWETDGIPISEITQKLILNTNTVTPLLKRMEAQGLLERQRSQEDERKVIIKLTDQGSQLRLAAASTPKGLETSLLSDELTLEELIGVKDKLLVLIHNLSSQSDTDQVIE